MADYLDYEKIKESKEGDIIVKCYYNGIKWICPNPNNETSCENVYQWYISSHKIECVEIKATNKLIESAIIVQK